VPSRANVAKLEPKPFAKHKERLACAIAPFSCAGERRKHHVKRIEPDPHYLEAEPLLIFTNLSGCDQEAQFNA